jgi:hypothetical protein
MTHRHILAVDPGEHCGWALYVDGRLDTSDTLDGSTATEPAEMIDVLCPDVIVAEDWHIPRRIRSGRTGLKAYAYRSMLWRALAESRGIEYVPVSPQSWRAWANAHIEGPPIPSGQKTAAHHEAIIEKARTVARARGIPDCMIVRDQCDAILIGEWYSRTQEAHMRRAT